MWKANNFKWFLRDLGFDLSRFNISENQDARFAKYLYLKKINCVLDVGANNGQYVEYLRKLGYSKKIISFEPLNNEFNNMKEKFKKDRNWIGYNFGLGKDNAIKDIKISKNSYSSSILKINKTHINAAKESRIVSKKKIIIKRLDEIKNIKNKKLNYFLKIDVQGYEDEVLEGSLKTLKKIQGIQIELSMVQLYERQKLFIYYINKLKKLGYDLWDLKKGFHNPKTGQVYQFDGFFLRK